MAQKHPLHSYHGLSTDSSRQQRGVKGQLWDFTQFGFPLPHPPAAGLKRGPLSTRCWVGDVTAGSWALELRFGSSLCGPSLGRALAQQ